MPSGFSEVKKNSQVDSSLTSASTDMRHMHIVILGTGFAGLGMAMRLKQRGYHDFVLLERAEDVGGNWRDNTYPGCACNVPSHLYSFSFAPNPNWSQAYPSQPEIHRYLRRCAEEFDLLDHIRWRTELLDALWDEEGQLWLITTTRGQFTADIVISGNGQLDELSLPNISGIERFEGVLFHSAAWKHDYDLRGKRVAVVGNGASAIQFVPQIQPLVRHLSLFQRTPAWILPLHDHPISARQQALFRHVPLTRRFERAKIYAQNEISALRLIQHPRALAPGMKLMNLGLQMARRHLMRQIPDPVLRARLTPAPSQGQILRSDLFYPAVSQANVEVVNDLIAEVRAHSIVTRDGREHEIDAIICATGFRVTNAQFPGRLRGRAGRALEDTWHAGTYAYLGTTVAGFPNLFLLCGPGTSLPHNSMICMIEAQITYILDCLKFMEQRQFQVVEVRASSQENFNAEMVRRITELNRVHERSGKEPESGKQHVPIWPGSTIEFWYRTRRFDPQHYSLSARWISSAEVVVEQAVQVTT
jgi:cation diffusion facilitator CzcD-associated flavoprotein CzcO